MIRIFYLAAISFYMLATLFPYLPFLKTMVSFLCMLTVFISLRSVRGLALIFGGFFLISGISMLIASHATFSAYVMSFGEMIQLVALFAIIPVLALPIQYGRYSDAVSTIIHKRINGIGQLYVLTSAVSYFFSSFMNLGALPLTYHSIAPSLPGYPIKHPKKYLNQAITHGYAMPLLWSPITPIVGTVLYLTGTAYARVLPLLLLLSVIGLLLDWGLNSMRMHSAISSEIKGHQQAAATRSYILDPPDHNGKLLQIFIAVLLLNGLIVFLDHVFPVSFLFLVSVVVIPFAYFWCVLIGQARPFFAGVRRHFYAYIPKMKNQFFIFLTAGFFITAMHTSHTDRLVTHWMDDLIQWTGFRAFMILLPLIPFALAFAGLHPAVGLALISEALKSQLLHQAPTVVTIAMLGGAIPAFLMGPYNATLGMMASLLDEKPFTLSNWNFSFTCFYLLLLTLFVQVLYAVL
ncbi:hypothetical protein M3N64_05425 [Sporolactobacillus sp. CPB3-1]|uniref:Citrate transporter-like domain-containing protein n=1 Tax=Sporolactobacillus mangiferae TaxID=2940498 RepID=A0ABT0M943_9BACL|nr:hypothetical protein [Sporolactobacillus mangiferae]MCL1631392.1 hypothetical protein [Sporolactobacillus mangiferae]